MTDENDQRVEKQYASSPYEWFDLLKEEGVIQLRLAYVRTDRNLTQERMSSAFVGGAVRWLIEAVKPSTSDVWEAKWEVHEQEEGQSSQWLVSYGRISIDTSHFDNTILSIQDAGATLKHALKEIRDFSEIHTKTAFTQMFDKPITLLSGSMEYPGDEMVLAADHPSLHRIVLTAASWASRVFGGMGSWNDISFEKRDDQEEYEELSNNLYNIINLSIIVAANPWPRPNLADTEDEDYSSIHIHDIQNSGGVKRRQKGGKRILAKFIFFAWLLLNIVLFGFGLIFGM